MDGVGGPADGDAWFELFAYLIDLCGQVKLDAFLLDRYFDSRPIVVSPPRSPFPASSIQCADR